MPSSFHLILSFSLKSSICRHISHKQKDLTKVKLSYAVAEEKKTLGNIIFVLIGLLQDNIKVDVPIQSSIIKRLILDPSTSSISVAGDEITINDTIDEVLSGVK